MKKLRQYIHETLGVEINPEPIPKNKLGALPMYIAETYRLYHAALFSEELILAEYRNKEEFSTLQLEKHLNLLKDAFNKKAVFFAEDLTSFNRKRLIEKGINFIVPGKQLYLPDFLVDLRERFENPKAKRKPEKLLPSAQFILLYHILHGKNGLAEFTFKELAAKLGYTPMAITKAVDDLKYHELCTVEGTKEKYIRFKEPVKELWRSAEPFMVNPVLKKVFADEKPKGVLLLPCNASALSEYSDMNPSRQAYLALDKTTFYALQKNKGLKNLNEQEGNYCIEVWKYNPEILVNGFNKHKPAVDPLSLYLSLKDSHDERTEMALKEIIAGNIK